MKINCFEKTMSYHHWIVLFLYHLSVFSFLVFSVWFWHFVFIPRQAVSTLCLFLHYVCFYTMFDSTLCLILHYVWFYTMFVSVHSYSWISLVSFPLLTTQFHYFHSPLLLFFFIFSHPSPCIAYFLLFANSIQLLSILYYYSYYYSQWSLWYIKSIPALCFAYILLNHLNNKE